MMNQRLVIENNAADSMIIVMTDVYVFACSALRIIRAARRMRNRRNEIINVRKTLRDIDNAQ